MVAERPTRCIHGELWYVCRECIDPLTVREPWTPEASRRFSGRVLAVCLLLAVLVVAGAYVTGGNR